MKSVRTIAGIVVAGAFLAGSAQAQPVQVGAMGSAINTATITCQTGNWMISAQVMPGTTSPQLLQTVLSQLQNNAAFLADGGKVAPLANGKLFVEAGSDDDVMFDCGGTPEPLNGASCNGFSMTAIPDVPTSSGWGMLLMIGALTIGGALMVRRQFAGVTLQS